MLHVLPPLPYPMDALEPSISANTLSFHHGKHHQTYVTNLNNLIKDTDLESLSLEEIIKKTAKNPDQVGIFNNAAQVWNHTFFWNCMQAEGGGKPTGRLLDMITESFNSYEEFYNAFKQAALTQFGSGWAWLVLDQGKLKITKTGNADLPMAHGMTALLTCDVWEHAYYLDYQNRRADFVDAFLTKLVNWSFVEKNLNV
ncbi:MAG: superoxide dismutase [Alphaproteobacteria bacterium]|nr:superoxide dismutase [Alphaproteobacteria bacterium]